MWRIRSSTVSVMTTRWTRTFLIWPTLCTRSKAWDSTANDHPRSREMTLLARVKFKPTPKWKRLSYQQGFVMDTRTSTLQRHQHNSGLFFGHENSNSLVSLSPVHVPLVSEQGMRTPSNKDGDSCALHMRNLLLSQILRDEIETRGPLRYYECLLCVSFGNWGITESVSLFHLAWF